MPITFLCGCGQSMTVADAYAGKMGRCPRCKQPVSVPMASTAAPPAAPPQFSPPPPPPGMPPMPLPPVPGAGTPRPMPRPGAAAPPPPGMPAPPPRPMPNMGSPATVVGAPAMPVPRGAPAAPPPRPGGPTASGPVARPGAARPGAAAKKVAKLLVVNGPQGYAGKAYPVQTAKPTVIGRDPQADVPIPSERISRRHCQLEPSEDGLFVVADLGSSNGTLVNQERIQGRKVLLGGEYIQVGDVLLRFNDA